MPPVELTNSASQNIPISLVLRSPFNRKPQVSDDFVANIRQFGVLQPVLVRPVELGLDRVNQLPQSAHVEIGSTVYELVAGERRWLASKKNGLPSIPAVIRSLTNVQVMEIQIAENDQREDYSVMDRSEAYARLRNEYMLAHKSDKGWTEEKCMDLIASNCKNDKIKGRTVQQIIALKKLTPDCQAALRKDEIEASHGYELCRRSPEDQAELLLWLRQLTHHLLGDIPSVRRLKLEIRKMDELREAEKRRQPLFTPPQPGTSTTPVPTVDDQLYAKALEVVREAKLHRMNDPLFLERNLKIEPASAHQLFVRLEKEGIVTPRDSHSERSYIFPKPQPSPQTSALSHGIDNRSAPPMPTLTPAARAKIAEQEKKRIEANRAREEKEAQTREIEKQARFTAMYAVAKKAKLDRDLIDLITIDVLVNSDDEISRFAQRTFGWPKARSGSYSPAEIEKIALARVPKLKSGEIASLLVVGILNEEMYFHRLKDGCKRLEAMARKNNVNLGKIRKDLAAAAKLKAKSQKPKAGVRA